MILDVVCLELVINEV